MLVTITRIATGLGIGVLGVVLNGCATAPPQQSKPSTKIASPPTTTKLEQRDAVKQTYKEFWKVTRSAGKEAPEHLRSTLAHVATRPVLPHIIKGIKRHKRRGVTLYGEVTANIENVRVHGEEATVRDCQDASNAGQADAQSGKPITVGVARNLIVATLLYDQNQGWRVSEIKYPGGGC